MSKRLSCSVQIVAYDGPDLTQRNARIHPSVGKHLTQSVAVINRSRNTEMKVPQIWWVILVCERKKMFILMFDDFCFVYSRSQHKERFYVVYSAK